MFFTCNWRVVCDIVSKMTGLRRFPRVSFFSYYGYTKYDVTYRIRTYLNWCVILYCGFATANCLSMSKLLIEVKLCSIFLPLFPSLMHQCLVIGSMSKYGTQGRDWNIFRQARTVWNILRLFTHRVRVMPFFLSVTKPSTNPSLTSPIINSILRENFN